MKKIKESFNDDEAFIRLYDEDYFLENSGKIVEEGGFSSSGQGSVVLVNYSTNELTGLLWKMVGADGPNGEIAYKFFAYKYPQTGMLNGKTFWGIANDFADDFNKAKKEI